MSFAGKLKEELASQIGVARHCRVAELAALSEFGLGEDRAFLSDRPMVREKSRRLLTLLRAKEIRQVLGEPSGETRPELLQAECCRRAYLRGAFLCAGTVSDPEKSYHFEILCGSAAGAEQLRELIGSLGVSARVVTRKRYHVVYVKEGAQIADLLGLMGASVSMLQFESARVVKEVRGNINRKVNCETANIEKTAGAAARQIGEIKKIREVSGRGALPAGLDEIATLRVKYPEATLSELGAMMDPPIGKSGVNHRLRKIHIIAESLGERKGGVS